MATKEEINKVIRKAGMTQRSWARTKGFNENSVQTFIKLYANSEKEPKGKIFKAIEKCFKKEFGLSIRREK